MQTARTGDITLKIEAMTVESHEVQAITLLPA
jgi:hypothetical protein